MPTIKMVAIALQWQQALHWQQFSSYTKTDGSVLENSTQHFISRVPPPLCHTQGERDLEKEKKKNEYVYVYIHPAKRSMSSDIPKPLQNTKKKYPK